tara:strand:- start:399 stop:1952 length:1554 start_codon:yes stop_codon:yes gene_type:complete
MKFNIQVARRVLANMVKAAPSNHPLNKLRPALSNIRQGANGWNGSRIWPLFEILAQAGGHTRDQLLSQIHDKQGEEILNYFSAFSTVGQTMDNWVETVSEDNLSAAPAPVTGPAPEATPAAPVPAAGSKAEALASLLAATLSEGEEETGSAIAKLQSDLTSLATRMGNDLGAVEAKAVEAAEAAAKSGGGASLSPAALRAAVSETITALSPSEEVIQRVAEGARELPPVEKVDPLFQEPSGWFESFCGWLMAGVHMVMGGSSGAGKTFPVKQACNKLGLPWKLISGNDVLQADELLFTAGIKGGTSYYSDGPLTHAMRHGYVLIVDEGDLLSQATSMIFNDALESREVTIAPTGEVVKAAPGFVVVFTSNSIGDDAGHYNREGFDPSLKQRLLSVIASPLPLEEEVEILCRLCNPDTGETLSTTEATLLAKWASVARPLHFGLNGSEPVLEEPCSTRVLVNAGCLWLGYNRDTGMTFPGLKETASDVRQSLFNTFANRAGEEGRAALRAADLWIFDQ